MSNHDKTLASPLGNSYTARSMRAFLLVISNTLVVSVTNFFVWFALIFWLYLETQSVLTTSIIGGAFMVISSLAGFWLGSIVDHHKKKSAMLISSFSTLLFFSAALLLLVSVPEESFTSIGNPVVWLMALLILFGVTSGNIRMIALPTLVTMLIPEGERDKANGVTGMVMGISSSGAGIFSGLALGYSSMYWVMVSAIILTVIAIIHLLFLSIPEKAIVHTQDKPKKVDVKGTIKAIRGVPGLFSLIFFTTFNNFLGGVFMALMDAYGLSLVSVQVWGTLWGFLSMGFILSGLYIAKKGLGQQPLRTLFTINIVTWSTCMFFVIQPSIVLLSIGTLVWVFCMPFIEATEHTIVQKVVPLERQGRVFGFAQSVEMSASPITAFLIGPIAQFIFIPFMTTGAGVELIGGWFGVGMGRGIALVFMIAGAIGLMVTLLARQSNAYKLLSSMYVKAEPVNA
jgi:DHA3 family multidrug efflux protein-like MFS transporter